MVQSDPASDGLADALNSASKPAIAWIERQRASALDVQRYTRFVGIMKRALPMAAAALLAAVLAYSLQPRLQSTKKMTITFQQLHVLSNDLMMTKPRLTGVDGNGNPYVVTAEEAIQDAHNSKSAQLKKVEADLTTKDGTWVNLTATRGLLDDAKELLWLSGIIDVYSDNGYEAHTTAARVDMNTGSVVGDKFVWGQGAFGTFYADKFRIDRTVQRMPKHAPRQAKSDKTKADKTMVYLYGNVHMTILKRGAAHR
ncbi:MAG TPA: LPS export ABC transporter periplasmic protein LptC [Rhizomicrobium sp.]|nr:LPS export ABC transporter periplasmic protein LptC [Rhizomicrobium sp.]